MSAAAILHQYGITNLVEMAGGLAAWEAAKLPVVSQSQTAVRNGVLLRDGACLAGAKDLLLPRAASRLLPAAESR